MSIPDNYFDILGRIESGNNPYAKSPTSSASGMFQFTKPTWLSLGGSWGDDASQPFGGLKPSLTEQQQRATTLTQQNALALQRAGVPVNSASLYAAHFFGAGTASKVLSANPDTPIASLVTSGAMKSNSFLQGMDVSGFGGWLSKKTGVSLGGSGSPGDTFRAGSKSI